VFALRSCAERQLTDVGFTRSRAVWITPSAILPESICNVPLLIASLIDCTWAMSMSAEPLAASERIVDEREERLTLASPCEAPDVPAALASGVGCVPKDRHHEGLVLTQSVAENATMTIAGLLGRFGFAAPAKKHAMGKRMIEALGIVAQGPDHVVSGLSGGNQQKVVMARALASNPDVLVLIDPTAGVDVKSKEALLSVVDRVREEGKAVLVVSSELDDLRTCDRVLVMFRGEVVAEMAAGWQDHELIALIEGVELHEE